MSLEVFRAALEWSDEFVALGGGEPTLHPLFWQFLGESIAKCESVWLATNGSQTEIALALAKMAKKGIIGCDLSLDEYHDSIEDVVRKAFTKDISKGRGYPHGLTTDNDSRRIRDVSPHLINAGRCDFGEDGCCCEEMQVLPDGTVRGCGCKDAIVLGNVTTPVEIPDWWEYGVCSKKQQKEEVA